MILAHRFMLNAAKVSNVEASISRHKRYILYNPELIAWLNKNRLQLELEADEFAGLY